MHSRVRKGGRKRTPNGLAATAPRAYGSWLAMRSRCECKSHVRYALYGGRGISVCERWQDFRLFLADMGEAPIGHTIDRVDHDKGYEPGNCRWATPAQQSLNTSRSLKLTHNGVTKTAHEWAQQLGIDGKTLRARLYRGWPVAKALSTPLGARA